MAASSQSVSSIEITAVTGRLDAATATQVRSDLKAVVQASRGRVILNLADLRFIDSSGLSVLVGTMKDARAEGGRIVLWNVPPMVRSLLELTRLTRVFEIYDTEENARKAFA